MPADKIDDIAGKIDFRYLMSIVEKDESVNIVQTEQSIDYGVEEGSLDDSNKENIYPIVQRRR
jgi:hypothetical protein